MELEWIAVSGIGENVGHDNRQAAKLTISLDSSEAPWYPEVSVNVAVDRRPELTWEELENQLKTNARAALGAALEHLDSGTIPELRRSAIDRRDRQDAESERRSQEELAAAISTIR